LFDNFSNSFSAVADRLAEIVGRPIKIIEGDVGHAPAVRSVLESEQIDAVIHFAALKAVADSVSDPLAYYANNVGGMIALLEAMDAEDVRTLVFSSSATVYGEPQRLPIDEDHPRRAVNPYGRTKLICEDILADLAGAGPEWRISILRYFNPVGAHPSGLIGEDPTSTPNNLMPLINRAASGRLAYLSVYGNDYQTEDGTAVRDYIHVMDLAEGHVAALDALERGGPLQVYNLGTGHGTSVLELIDAFESANNVRVPRKPADRRPKDVASVFAAVEKAERQLQWRATRSLPEMCADSWRFAKRSG
jgi:UDP-glucose 4-epimerase